MSTSSDAPSPTTSPSLDSPLPYFRGKAELERYLQDSGVSHAILRPTVVFGREDILLNNIAYLLRRFPVFVMPGSGEYCLQPVYVDDLAQIAVKQAEGTADAVLDVAERDDRQHRDRGLIADGRGGEQQGAACLYPSTHRRHLGLRKRSRVGEPRIPLSQASQLGSRGGAVEEAYQDAHSI